MRKLNQLDVLTMEDLVMPSKKLHVDYDENYDLCQEQEDDWVSDILGTEDQTIGDLINE